MQRGNQSIRYQSLIVKDVLRDESAITDVLSAIMADELSNGLVLLHF